MSVTTTKGKEGGFGETVRVIVHALIIALVIRTFLFQPFNIPSGSMKETLLVGDYLFVSKYSYGYSYYSFPFSPPLFSGRIFGSEPDRGDIVVFRLPKDDSTDYIKRVIGLPGDRIRMIGGLLHINGQPVKRERIEDYIETEETERATRVKRWRETLPNGVSYTTLDLIDNGFYDNTQEYVVPAGHYFMMGDNRDNSTDSRVLSQVGYVPFQNLVGRAQLIFFSRRRRRARLAGLALAMDRPLEPAVLDRAMSRKAEPKSQASAAAIARESGVRESGAPPSGGGKRKACRKPQSRAQGAAATAAREDHRLSFFRRGFARTRADAYLRLERRAGPHRQLSAARISRRSCARPRDFGNAVCGLSEGRRGRVVAPSRRSRAPRNLRRCRARDRSWRVAAARRLRSEGGRPLARRDPGRCLRVADRRDFPRRRLSGGARIRRAFLGRADAKARAAACAIPKPCCRNGRRRAVCRRRPIAKSNAPARITIRSSAWP